MTKETKELIGCFLAGGLMGTNLERSETMKQAMIIGFLTTVLLITIGAIQGIVMSGGEALFVMAYMTTAVRIMFMIEEENHELEEVSDEEK